MARAKLTQLAAARNPHRGKYGERLCGTGTLLQSEGKNRA